MSTSRVSARPMAVHETFYVWLVVLAVLFGALTYYIDTKPYVVVEVDPNALVNALGAYTSAGSLLTTLATGLLGGMGWFFTNRSKRRYTARDLWPGVAGAFCACVSIYFGYIASQNITWLVENSIESLNLAKIQWPRNLQFYALLLGVFCFADFLRRDWKKVDQHEE
jgi:hypothetical protein